MRIDVRPAITERDRDAAFRLRHQMYAQALGYRPGEEPDRHRDRFDAAPTSLTLNGSVDGRVLATLRVSRDDARLGLPTDTSFDHRASGVFPDEALASLSHLCCGPETRGLEDVLDALLRTAYEWIQQHGGDRILAAFSPPMRGFMTRFGFQEMTTAPCIDRVLGVPMVPMTRLLPHASVPIAHGGPQGAAPHRGTGPMGDRAADPHAQAAKPRDGGMLLLLTDDGRVVQMGRHGADDSPAKAPMISRRPAIHNGTWRYIWS